MLLYTFVSNSEINEKNNAIEVQLSLKSRLLKSLRCAIKSLNVCNTFSVQVEYMKVQKPHLFKCGFCEYCIYSRI